MNDNFLNLASPWRQRLAEWLERASVQYLVTGLILINAVILGLETSSTAMQQWGHWLRTLDQLILACFVIEIALRFTALRVLRVLRLISLVPSMKMVVQSLLASLPGMGSIVALLGLVFYVAAVIATQLFGEQFPQWFGTLGDSLYTLFQVMTLESWSMGIVRPVMEEFPYAWLYFIPFILIATFMMLNLFIAVIVDAIQNQREKVAEQEQEQAPPSESALLLEEVRQLRAELRILQQRLPPNEP